MILPRRSRRERMREPGVLEQEDQQPEPETDTATREEAEVIHA